MRKLFVLLVLSAAALPSPAQEHMSTRVASRIEEHVKPFVENRDFSGVIYIARGNTVLYSNAFGMADWSENIPMQINTPLPVASLTKSMTAAAIMQLAGAGSLDLDAKIKTWLPAAPHAGRVTVRHLLEHRSGLRDFYDLGLGPTLWDQSWPRDALLKKLGRHPLLFRPGSKHFYTNAGYMLLAKIVETISGRSYAEYMRDNILSPAGMKASYFPGEKVTESKAPSWIAGPPPLHLKPAMQQDLSHLYGAADLTSSAPDLHAWAVWVLEHQKMLDLDGRAFGWARRSLSNGTQLLEQNGILGGYMANIRIFPDDGTVIIVLSNIRSAAFTLVHSYLPGILAGASGKAISLPTPLPIEAAALATLAGTYQSKAGAWNVFSEDGHLYMQWHIDGTIKYLTPIGKNQFFVRMEYYQVRFSDSADRLTISTSRGDQIYRRK